MKKGLITLAGLFLLISCNETKDSSTTGNNDHAAMATQNAAHNKEIYRAIETGDVSKLDSFITKDVVDHNGNMGKDIVGIDSVKAFIGNIHNYFDGLKMESVSEATSEDGVYHFALVHMTGTAKQNPWGMPAGQKVDDMSVDVVKIKDGKASDHWSFTSMKDMMEMMSAMPGGGMSDGKKNGTQ
ncbi:MAG TPA: nuclear transport factor 2 family protein [Flavisolibacter sp.]|jgi:predicted SnoaL-like aldol condensation-catalyzing enzyme|nr:nuclear transport factor 2 family protein [Flavisolibacter sp.]